MSVLRNAERKVAHHARNFNEYISRAPLETCQSAVAAAQTRAKLGRPLSVIDGQQIAVKDNICTKNLPTTCGSLILKGFQSPYDATVVTRLEAAGAIVVGKTNLDEFGMGSHNTTSFSGYVSNPNGHEDDPTSAGGSSGGSAVAVASGSCYGALGTDTGGSVRLPAAYCQVVGFKPSYGRISRFGVVAYANSLDTVGVLGINVERVREIFHVLDSPDHRDPTCLTSNERKIIRGKAPVGERARKLKIGIPIEYNIDELHDNVRHSWISMAKRLKKCGHEILPVTLPATKVALAAYYIIAPAEASSNLAKYDGVRYGQPSTSSRSKDEVLFSRTRLEGLGEEVRRRILLGSYSLSSTAIDNYFLQAQKIRRRVQDDFNRVFAQDHQFLMSESRCAGAVDLLMAPTAPTGPPSLSNIRQGYVIDGYKDDVFTVPASLAGLPAVSVPVSRNGVDEGRPKTEASAIQFIGQYGDDDLVLEAASILEQL